LGNFDDENIIDADFEEIKDELLKDKDIRKTPLYYSRIQVAKILGEDVSTISYWSTSFQPILNLKIVNMARKYTKKDIENLLFIQKLIRHDHMSIKQVLEYCSEKGFSLENETIEDNPLAVKTFVSAMTDEFDKKILEMQNKIILQQQEMIQNLENIIVKNNEDIKMEIGITVNELVSEKLSEIGGLLSQQNEIALSKIDEMEKKATERDIQLIDKLRESQEKHKQEYEENIKNENKGFLKRLFNKK